MTALVLALALAAEPRTYCVAARTSLQEIRDRLACREPVAAALMDAVFAPAALADHGARLLGKGGGSKEGMLILGDTGVVIRVGPVAPDCPALPACGKSPPVA